MSGGDLLFTRPTVGYVAADDSPALRWAGRPTVNVFFMGGPRTALGYGGDSDERSPRRSDSATNVFGPPAARCRRRW
ncbi:hypothetical protein STCU_12284 [Strigomonas culicis]|uniref:Uncharacterized protein n=1 Tax=Strigomonas culicis TaxID=28005 RepID=S9UKK6_9TRYP|nr:hypothetical protein STCU_12284 [Strigomonas culicis]|eukprot:EPY15176.1 hypothetical protein STCU_12284 [Strigomonas culicis]